MLNYLDLVTDLYEFGSGAKTPMGVSRFSTPAAMTSWRVAPPPAVVVTRYLSRSNTYGRTIHK